MTLMNKEDFEAMAEQQKRETNNLKTMKEQTEKRMVNQFIEMIEEIENPYPLDIFKGETEEGRFGQFGHKVWENCKEEILSNLNTLIPSRAQESTSKEKEEDAILGEEDFNSFLDMFKEKEKEE